MIMFVLPFVCVIFSDGLDLCVCSWYALLLLLEGFSFFLFLLFDSGGSDVKRGAGGEEPAEFSPAHSKNSPPTTLHLMQRFHIERLHVVHAVRRHVCSSERGRRQTY